MLQGFGAIQLNFGLFAGVAFDVQEGLLKFISKLTATSN